MSRHDLVRWLAARHIRRRHLFAAVLTAILVLLSLLRPARVHAACGVMDVAACLDGVQYSFWHGIASFLWTLLRTMLQITYQLDQFRHWLVTVAFSGAYQAIVGIVEPAYAPLATIALLVAVLAMMLAPLTGVRGLSIRHVLTWAVLTPILVAVIGQIIAQAEEVRMSIGGAMAAQSAGATPGAIFGPSGSDMAPVAPLYPANPCGTGELVRPDAVAITLDDLAAALLYADASDIWCPDARGPSRDLPDGFFADPPLYAVDANVGDLTNPVDRTNAITGLQRGVSRMLLSILPALLAIVAAATNLVFAVSLIALWIMVPVGLLVVFFQQSAAVVSGMLPCLVRTFQLSWGSMVLMGALMGALQSAAASGNAAAYAGFSVCALFIQGYILVMAFRTLGTNLLSLDRTVQTVTGMSAAEPVRVAATATTTAAAAATGMGAVALAAQYASRDLDLRDQASYVSSALLGRMPGVAQVGEVAAAMGMLDPDSPGYRGMRAGDLSTEHWRWARMQMERDHQALGGTAAVRATTSPSQPAPAAAPTSLTAAPAYDDPGPMAAQPLDAQPVATMVPAAPPPSFEAGSGSGWSSRAAEPGGVDRTPFRLPFAPMPQGFTPPAAPPPIIEPLPTFDVPQALARIPTAETQAAEVATIVAILEEQLAAAARAQQAALAQTDARAAAHAAHHMAHLRSMIAAYQPSVRSHTDHKG